MIGSRLHPKATCQRFTWRMAKPTLQQFYDYARKQLKIGDQGDIRSWLKDPHLDMYYLITFPHKFSLKEHHVVLEKGRYNKWSEYLIMVCILKGGKQSKYYPIIIEKNV